MSATMGMRSTLSESSRILSRTSSGCAEINDYGVVLKSAQHYLDGGIF